jgi:hypothetical protein
MLSSLPLFAGAPAKLVKHPIATDLRGGYQVIPVDMNKDGRPDLIAVASGSEELAWYENPGWQRHIIVTGLSRPINAAAWDADGDGVPEIVLAQGFSNDPRASTGVVSLLKHKGDPRDPWTITEIDRLPSSHRLRFVDIDGTGRKVAVNAPLSGAAAAPPDYKEHIPLVFYRPGTWKRELISDALSGVMHGINSVDWDQDGREEVLSASFEGIHLFKFGKDGKWQTRQLAKGSPEAWPKGGSSDVSAGKLGKHWFLAAIEPWHGNQVVVYTERDGGWNRQVLDDSFIQGHALTAVDLNGDGNDEIVAGYRGKGQSTYVYYADDATGAHWTRVPLDEGQMGASSVAALDLNGDGIPDLVSIDSTRLTWYANVR